ncbi:DUF1636 family protein [Amycolatopsis dendrobii]|uniref:DUF1636 family protein n=1 Tax=Amycolatopsis dendrobii TaxID=2760662 RepID=A0A7W3VZN9_9PSEU|nr:DUF1636 family protein [Amycolatopsis dendrobii]MBB1156080.1 DUF1636 family protein [Amycolatopsis dendrobii]
MTLLVCATCPRYDPQHSGEFSHALTAAIAEHLGGDKVGIRHVQCLGGCPRDGVVALDGPGKARVRFSRLTVDDTDAILRAAHAHDACFTGVPGDWEIPGTLAGRVSSITLKRTAHTPFGAPGGGQAGQGRAPL